MVVARQSSRLVGVIQIGSAKMNAPQVDPRDDQYQRTEREFGDA
jgi:hypothetical protein